ncbi:MAG: GC-type dockerin domain-anchored protein [Phycisphaerales bacterium]
MSRNTNTANRAARTRNLTQSAGLALCMAAGVASITATAPEARGDELWRQTKRYTAQVVGAYEAAVAKLDEAKDALEDAKDLLSALRTALTAAGGAVSNPALAARVAQAAATVATAEGVVAAAAEAVVVATAAAAAFLAGTGIGQGANYLISWCWDPICEFDGAATYAFPDDAQVDQWVERMLLNSTGVPITKADFDAAEAAFPGTGAVSWDYLRQTVRTYAIAARGIGAYTNTDYDGVLAAAQDLQDQTDVQAATATQFAAHFATVQTFTTDPRGEMQDAINELQSLLPDVGQLPNPVATQAMIQDAIASMQQAVFRMDQISAFPAGPAQQLDGEVFNPLTIQAYQQFLDDCRVNGAAALPMVEVRGVDDIMNSLGLVNRGQGTMAHDIAFWDGVGDTANEAARFGPGGVSLNSEILIDSANFYWRSIDLSESPLVHNALADRQGTFFEFEQPLFFPGQIPPSSVWIATPDLPGFESWRCLPYPPSPLGIDYLMGGRDQFLGVLAPPIGTQHGLDLLLPPPSPPPFLLPPVVVGLDLHLQSVVLNPAGASAGGVSVQTAAPGAGVRVQFQTAGQDRFQPVVETRDAAGAPMLVPLPIIDEGWHHMSIMIDPQTGEIIRFTLINNSTAQGAVFESPAWFVAPAGTQVGPVQHMALRAGGGVAAGSVAMGVDNVAVAYMTPSCDADLTTTAIAGTPGYGVPNGVLDNNDFFYYLAQFAAGNAAVADLTTSAVPGSPGYGVPNGDHQQRGLLLLPGPLRGGLLRVPPPRAGGVMRGSASMTEGARRPRSRQVPHQPISRGGPPRPAPLHWPDERRRRISTRSSPPRRTPRAPPRSPTTAPSGGTWP